MDIALKINKLIFERKVKKIDLYRKVGISKQTLEDYLNEKTSPTVAKLEKIAEFFNVPIVYFFENDKQIIQNGTNNQVGHINVISAEQAQQIKYLKDLLEEKERTIKILMEKSKIKKK